MKYRLVKDVFTGEINKVFREEDLTWIPFDPANTDYQKYLEWLAEGNEPLPPDPVEGQ
jgi:hypothetical protein